MKLKAIGKFIGVSFTVLIALLYLVSCLTSYISPEKFPLLTILSIGYLVLLPVYFFTAFVWFFINRKIGLLLLLLILIGYRNLTSTIAFNFFEPSNTRQEQENSIRILSWNINEFGDNLAISDTLNGKRQNMLAFIKQMQPDILLLQDFTENLGRKEYVTNLETVLHLDSFMSYHFASYKRIAILNFTQLYGVAIFSKFPIVDTGSITINPAISEERSAFIDVLFGQRKIRLINSHLTSMNLWPSENAGIKYIEGDESISKLKSVFSKLLYYGQAHATEARVLRNLIDTTNIPLVFCGDLNSVPSSYIYQQIKGNLKDVFIEKGFFLGGTYTGIFPKVRIDVMLHSKELEVVNYYRPVLNYSDHCPIIADLKWKE